MNPFALALVVLSTLTHAYWNYILKRTSGGVIFVWLFTTITTLLYVPLFIALYKSIDFAFTKASVTFCILSIGFHLAYFMTLEQAYKHGDLSIIYPITRGVSPVFTIGFAIMCLHEKLTRFQVISILLILLGTFILSGSSVQLKKKSITSLGYALLCGLMISGYTLIDRQAVSVLFVSPFMLDFLNNLGRTILLSPYAFKDKAKTRFLFKHHIREAVIIAVFSPLTYLLVLFAMRMLPISIIAPLRQLSIIVSGILGVTLLNENKSYLKVAGVAMTFTGVALLFYPQ